MIVPFLLATASFAPDLAFASTRRPLTHGTWSVYQTSGTSQWTGGAAIGANGERWFTVKNAYIRMDAVGAYTVIPTGSSTLSATALARGTDAALYSTGCCVNGQFVVMKMTSDGSLSTYVPPSRNLLNAAVTLGPDGNVWFSESSHVGNISPAGKIVEYPVHLPDGLLLNSSNGIGVGGDHKVWFSISNFQVAPYNGWLANVDPTSGKIAEIGVTCFDPQPLVGGTDGNLYAACRDANGPDVGLLQMTPKGVATKIPNPYAIDEASENVMAASRQAIWFITGQVGAHPGTLGKYELRTKRFRDYPTPVELGELNAIAVDGSGAVWCLGVNDQVGVFRP
ncbi:MAG: hypothetical protein ABI202_02245 [Candidatus Baltobacteraceae bacterium]